MKNSARRMSFFSVSFQRAAHRSVKASVLTLLSLALAVGNLAGANAAPSVASPDDMSEARVLFSQMQQSNNPVIANLAKETLQRLRGNAKAPQTRIEVRLLTQQNDSLAVPVLVDTAEHRQVMATFLVDTGASYTVITPRLAAKLGVVITPDTPRMSILTANGMIQAPRVTVPKLSLGGVTIPNVEVIVQDLGSDLLLSGLLGMNAFRGMELTVQRDRLILGVNPGASEG